MFKIPFLLADTDGNGKVSLDEVLRPHFTADSLMNFAFFEYFIGGPDQKKSLEKEVNSLYAFGCNLQSFRLAKFGKKRTERRKLTLRISAHFGRRRNWPKFTPGF